MKKIRLKTMKELADYYVTTDNDGYKKYAWARFKCDEKNTLSYQTYPVESLGNIFIVEGETYKNYTVTYKDLALDIEKEHCYIHNDYLVSIPEDLFDI